MAGEWSPKLYLRFAEERTRPARDLLAQVPLEEVRLGVDMGCGPGNSTELLIERWPEASIVGLDSSDTMLAEARARLPQARFERADAAHWLPEPETDLVFGNAIYQWVPDLLSVLARTLGAMRPGAVLAVQMPDNLEEPTHRLMREVAGQGPWAEKLQGVQRETMPSLPVFYDALAPLASRIDLWHTVYNHVLTGPEAIVEWVKGTGLRPFLAPLEADEQQDFLGLYTEQIAKSYPSLSDGKVMLRFPRLFLIACR